MHIELLMFYVPAYSSCNGEMILGNSSIFGPVNIKFDTSVSLSCRRISCRTDLDAMVQCHMEAGCMAVWFHLDGNNNTMCDSCVCMDGDKAVN